MSTIGATMDTTFGKRLESILGDRGLSQREVGRRLGVSGTTIGNWIAGTATPTRDNLRALSDTLGVTAMWLEYGVHKGATGPADSERAAALARINAAVQQFSTEQLLHVERVVLDLLNLVKRPR